MGINIGNQDTADLPKKVKLPGPEISGNFPFALGSSGDKFLQRGVEDITFCRRALPT